MELERGNKQLTKMKMHRTHIRILYPTRVAIEY
jgi:hypothetical protein